MQVDPEGPGVCGPQEDSLGVPRKTHSIPRHSHPVVLLAVLRWSSLNPLQHGSIPQCEAPALAS